MKALVLFLLTAIAGLAAAAAAGASAPAHVASSAPPCVPKLGTTGGHAYVDYCGPATATLTIGGKTVDGKTVGGKTYSFSHGYCATDTKNHIQLQMQLGVIEVVKSPVNGGQVQFQLQEIKEGSLTIANVTADSGGKVLVSGGATFKGPLTKGGTFASSAYASPTFSGTWDCHNVVWAQ